MKPSVAKQSKGVMRNHLAFIGLGLAVALGLAGCSAGTASPAPSQQASGGLMPAPYPPGHWYGANEFVSLEEAAARVPFVIWLPDEAVVGAKLASVELNLPDNVLAVALHYENGIVVAQNSARIVKSMESMKKEWEQLLEVNGNPALGKETGYTVSNLTGRRVLYPATVTWYQDNVSRTVVGYEVFSMDSLLQIARSMKPYTPAAQ